MQPGPPIVSGDQPSTGNENAKAFGWKRTTSFLIKSLQICTKRLQGTKFLLQKSKRTSKVRTQKGTRPSLLPLQPSRRPLTEVPTPHSRPLHTRRLRALIVQRTLGGTWGSDRGGGRKEVRKASHVLGSKSDRPCLQIRCSSRDLIETRNAKSRGQMHKTPVKPPSLPCRVPKCITLPWAYVRLPLSAQAPAWACPQTSHTLGPALSSQA